MLDTYPDVLTAREVAEILRLSTRAVYEYLDSGAIPSFRLRRPDGSPGRRVFILKKTLLEYMEGER